MTVQGAALAFVDCHRVAQGQDFRSFLIRQTNLFSSLRTKMQLISNVGDRVPYGICNAVLNLRPNQWRALIQQYGPVFAFQQARLFGGQAAVDILIDLLSPGICHRQGYVRLAFCLKQGSRLAKTIAKLPRPTQEPEVVQPCIRALTDIQIDPNWCDGFHQIARHKCRHALTMVRILYRWKLAIISRKYHKTAIERTSAYDVQEEIFTQKSLVKYQRVFEKPFWIRCFNLLRVIPPSNCERAT